MYMLVSQLKKFHTINAVGHAELVSLQILPWLTDSCTAPEFANHIQCQETILARLVQSKNCFDFSPDTWFIISRHGKPNKFRCGGERNAIIIRADCGESVNKHDSAIPFKESINSSNFNITRSLINYCPLPLAYGMKE